jgi:flagellar hook assembly protein FlgD
VNFTIYDVCGQKVKTIINGYQEAGQFSITWTGCDEKGRKLAAGIYFGRIEVGKNAVTNKLILIR